MLCHTREGWSKSEWKHCEVFCCLNMGFSWLLQILAYFLDLPQSCFNLSVAVCLVFPWWTKGLEFPSLSSCWHLSLLVCIFKKNVGAVRCVWVRFRQRELNQNAWYGERPQYWRQAYFCIFWCNSLLIYFYKYTIFTANNVIFSLNNTTMPANMLLLLLKQGINCSTIVRYIKWHNS